MKNVNNQKAINGFNSLITFIALSIKLPPNNIIAIIKSNIDIKLLCSLIHFSIF